tara:strand:+ start:43400 stop:43525 length:126 start_codon:yes stop_codon:yes gene_type:complete
MQEPEEKKEIPPTDDATGVFEFPDDDDDDLKELYTDHHEGS